MQKKITSLEELTTEQKKELHQLNSKVKNKKIEFEELQNAFINLEKNKDKEIEHLKSVLEIKEIELLNQNEAPKSKETILNDKVLSIMK